MRAFLVLLPLVILAACGEDDPPAVDAPKACNDTADEVGKVAARCQGDYQLARDAFTGEFGGCDKVKTVRDEKALRDTCIPYFAKLSCEDYKNSELDSTCKNQFGQ